MAAHGSKYFINDVVAVKSLDSAATLLLWEDFPAELTEVLRCRGTTGRLEEDMAAVLSWGKR